MLCLIFLMWYYVFIPQNVAWVMYTCIKKNFRLPRIDVHKKEKKATHTHTPFNHHKFEAHLCNITSSTYVQMLYINKKKQYIFFNYLNFRSTPDIINPIRVFVYETAADPPLCDSKQLKIQYKRHKRLGEK